MNEPTMYDHTPGPWIVVEDRVPSSIEIFSGKTAIAECWRRADTKKERADSRLIAAAPNLLRERDELRAKLDRIASIAGNPDATQACRLIIKECEL